MLTYRDGIEAAREVVLMLLRQWLDENRHLPDEEQGGYPPFHLMRAADAIADLHRNVSTDARAQLIACEPGSIAGDPQDGGQ